MINVADTSKRETQQKHLVIKTGSIRNGHQSQWSITIHEMTPKSLSS